MATQHPSDTLPRGEWIEWSGGPVPVEGTELVGYVQFLGETREQALRREPSKIDYWPWFGQDELPGVSAFLITGDAA